MSTIAELMIRILTEVGVRRIYGIVGDSLNGLTDALRHTQKIEWIGTRHEEVAAIAAGAEAQLTGELAVCAGSCGPGNLHLINGLFEAQRNQVPVLAIAAHIPTSEIGGNYFQETHPQILFKECSYFCEFVSSAEQMPRMLSMAIQTAYSRRGVAVLVIPGDLAIQQSVAKDNYFLPKQANPVITPNQTELQEIANVLNHSKKITLLCGAGCKDAHAELLQLGEKLKSPMVHALRGKEYVEYDNPFDVGMTGFIGFASGYYALDDCETLLILGSNFPYRQFYPTKSKIIQVDIAGEAIGRRCAVDIGVIGDVKSTIKVLLPLLQTHSDSSFLEKAVSHYKKSRQALDDLAVNKKGQIIHPQYLAKLINEKATEDTIFTCDVGTPTVWAARYLQMNGKRRLLGSFNHGTMANALAQAIGAQATYPNRQVVAMCGDGGFSMLMGDVISLIQHGFPLKIVIFNNGTLGFVELEMKASGYLEFGTELVNPNFGAMAEAIGIKGFRVENADDLSDTLEQAFAHPGPAIVDVKVNRLELLMPPKITAEQIKGFGLYVSKAIINGRGDEVFELVKSNLWR